MRLARILASACGLGLAACAAAPSGAGGAAPSLAGTRWVGVVDAATDRRAVPRLEFVREGRVSGFTGCNMLSGTWRTEGAEVRFGPVATTKRLCAGAEGETEKRLLAVLGEKGRATLEGGRLVLSSADGGRFEFREAPPGY